MNRFLAVAFLVLAAAWLLELVTDVTVLGEASSLVFGLCFLTWMVPGIHSAARTDRNLARLGVMCGLVLVATALGNPVAERGTVGSRELVGGGSRGSRSSSPFRQCAVTRTARGTYTVPQAGPSAEPHHGCCTRLMALVLLVEAHAALVQPR